MKDRKSVMLRLVLLLLGLAYLSVPPLVGMVNSIERDEATVAGGRPLNTDVSCLSRPLGLWCSARFDLKISGRTFSHTSLLANTGTGSLIWFLEQGLPVTVHYEPRACWGRLCGALEVAHAEDTLVAFGPVPARNSLFIWATLIAAGFCFQSALAQGAGAQSGTSTGRREGEAVKAGTG